MSGLSYGDVSSQGRNFSKMHPSEGASQFNATLTFQCSVQDGTLLEQGQHPPPLGSTSSRGVSQFKTPLQALRFNIQASKLRALDHFSLAPGVPPFNEAQLFPVTDPLQPIVLQSEKRIAQKGYHPSSGIDLSNDALQHTSPIMSPVGALALPSISACETSPTAKLIGSTSSRGVSQFKTPLQALRFNIQASKLRALDHFSLAPGVPPFNEAQLFPVTDPLQPIVLQSEKRIAQKGYHPSSGIDLSNDALQHTSPIMSPVGALAFPSISACETSPTAKLIRGKIISLPVYPHISNNPHLVAQRQGQSSQGLRELERSWQPVLSRSEARVRPKALRRVKVQVTMKLILVSGAVGLVEGIASLLLLSFPTYLVVTWAILLIVFSNLVNRELCSYYRLTSAMLDMEVVHPSTISPSHSAGHPMHRDISATMGYSHRCGLKGIGLAQGTLGYPQIPFSSSLAEESGRKRVRKSRKVPMPHEPCQGAAAHWKPAQVRVCTRFFKVLCSVVKNGHPAQTLPSEKECKV